MTSDEIRSILSVVGYRVAGGTILDVMDYESVLASQPRSAGYLFVVLKLKNGKVAALWENHAAIAESLDVMFGDAEHDPILNHHERLLLTYGNKA